MPRIHWDLHRILTTLRQLHRRGENISYSALARDKQSLVSAAAYHFGSYRSAVQQAGIDYADVTRRPRWTKQLIIKAIKQARCRGEDLHWAAVSARRDELGKAAFAALQPRLFGRWDRALQGAGLDAAEVSQYRRWDRSSIAFELRSRAQADEPMNSGAIQRDDPGLHAAAVRHFGDYDRALRAARLEPSKVRRRHHWDRDEVVRQLKTLQKSQAKSAASKSSVKATVKSAKSAGSRSTAESQSKLPFKSHALPLSPTARGVQQPSAIPSTPRASAAPSAPSADTQLRREHAALYSAAMRLFGSIAAARAAAESEMSSHSSLSL